MSRILWFFGNTSRLPFMLPMNDEMNIKGCFATNVKKNY